MMTSHRKELKRILQMKKTSPTSFKKGRKEPLTPEGVALQQAGWKRQGNGVGKKSGHATWWSPAGNPTHDTRRAYNKMKAGVDRAAVMKANEDRLLVGGWKRGKPGARAKRSGISPRTTSTTSPWAVSMQNNMPIISAARCIVFTMQGS
ncbi:hypothetical protein RI054_20g90350 [Pseudoscourfieldia marina]